MQASHLVGFPFLELETWNRFYGSRHLCGAEVATGELEILLPIVVGHVVNTGTVVVSDGVTDGLINGGRLFDTEALFSEEAVNGLGV